MSSSIATTKKSWATIVGKPENVGDNQMETVAVIEIHEEIVEAKPQHQAFTQEKKGYSTEVDPIAMEVARDFYECHQDNIIGITRRNDLHQYFQNEFPNAQREFPVVLYALAKGLKLVNCFNRGQDLEWRTPPKSMKKKKSAFSKKITKEADGWMTVGKPQPITIQPELTPKEDFTPSPKFSREVEVPKSQKPIDGERLDDNQIISRIASFKADIKILDNEIECFLCFHREHLREMKRLENLGDELSIKLAKFHDQCANNLETMLDELQTEANKKIKAKNQFCDLLKQ